MGRVVSLLVGINAALAIATYLGVKIVVNKGKRRARLIFEKDDEQNEESK